MTNNDPPIGLCLVIIGALSGAFVGCIGAALLDIIGRAQGWW